MSALIIDLRNNPGGLLDSAVAVAGKFIEKDKLVVSTKGRQPSQNMELTAASAKPILDLPMAVLINEGSASGSEIVAGALQNYKRAVIIGTKSFGKGSVQTIIPLNDGSALRLTTSKYFTPNGTVIHGKGVMPDIVIPNGKPFDLTHDIDIQEKQKAEEIFDNIEKKETEMKTGDQDYTSDMQLVRAIDILKALKIFKQNSK
jgi:carboxyl-terminal processing protease